MIRLEPRLGPTSWADQEEGAEGTGPEALSVEQQISHFVNFTL